MKRLLTVIAVLQAILGIRVVTRMMRTGRGTRIARSCQPRCERAAALLPALNEAARIRPCLDGLLAQSDETAEIVVIDGGSSDGTQSIVREFAERDARVRLIEITPPEGENGKAHGLEAGARASTAEWIVTIDADVQPHPALIRSLLAHAGQEAVNVMSVATRQRLSGTGEGLIHPAMLTTLIYRFGIPGASTDRPGDVQANGQCFLVRRDVLEEIGGFAAVTGEIAEDVALARRAARAGHRVGFYESNGLVDVAMYANWRETWCDWSRSLPLRDANDEWRSIVGLTETILVQAAPLWLAPIARGHGGAGSFASRVNLALLATSLGVLIGARRAYLARPFSYWISPLFDAPVAAQIVANAIRRRHVWRGRAIYQGGAR
jgi:dolichol-phosphate mannosyltransferase